MSAEMLELSGAEWPARLAGPMVKADEALLELLRQQKRLTEEHEPLAQQLLILAATLEQARRDRPAGVTLASAEHRAIWERLTALQAPVEAESDDFDVILLPVVADAS